MADEVYDQMMDIVKKAEQARDKVDVSRIVAQARIRLEIDITRVDALNQGRALMDAGDIEGAVKVCKEYGNYIDRLKNDLEEHGKREYSDMVREEAL